MGASTGEKSDERAKKKRDKRGEGGEKAPQCLHEVWQQFNEFGGDSGVEFVNRAFQGQGLGDVSRQELDLWTSWPQCLSLKLDIFDAQCLFFEF